MHGQNHIKFNVYLHLFPNDCKLDSSHIPTIEQYNLLRVSAILNHFQEEFCNIKEFLCCRNISSYVVLTTNYTSKD